MSPYLFAALIPLVAVVTLAETRLLGREIRHAKNVRRGQR
jgi:hypothetical protein